MYNAYVKAVVEYMQLNLKMKVMFVLQIENGKTLNNTYIGFEGRRFETRAQMVFSVRNF